ncbi:cytochrome P450 [Pseudomonas sp. SWRI99]|nr:cytochrome P450 [Pseudomonas sp. SWRI99]
MRPAHAPVQARAGKLAAQGRQVLDFYSQTEKQRLATFTQAIRLLVGCNDLQLATVDAAAEQLRGYFIELLAEPASDFLSAIQQRFAGDQDTLIANLTGLCSQTFEACAGLIGNTLSALRRQPALRGESIEALLNEVQRFDPPVQNTRRFVATCCDIDGMRLEAGDVIVLLLASANRDPALNDQPERFLLDRPNRRSFSFGSGRHECPGQGLAMCIAAATLKEILASGLDLNCLSWSYRPSLNGRVPLFNLGGV